MFYMNARRRPRAWAPLAPIFYPPRRGEGGTLLNTLGIMYSPPLNVRGGRGEIASARRAGYAGRLLGAINKIFKTMFVGAIAQDKQTRFLTHSRDLACLCRKKIHSYNNNNNNNNNTYSFWKKYLKIVAI